MTNAGKMLDIKGWALSVLGILAWAGMLLSDIPLAGLPNLS